MCVCEGSVYGVGGGGCGVWKCVCMGRVCVGGGRMCEGVCMCLWGGGGERMGACV